MAVSTRKSTRKQTRKSSAGRKGRPTKCNNKVSWENRMKDLTAYQKKYGNTNVPTALNQSLSAWVSTVKNAYKKMGRKKTIKLPVKLNPTRISQLKKIGFDFTPNPTQKGRSQEEKKDSVTSRVEMYKKNSKTVLDLALKKYPFNEDDAPEERGPRKTDTCWEINKPGGDKIQYKDDWAYPRLKYKSYDYRLHICALVFKKGGEYPKEVVSHKCGNNRCFNPDHLVDEPQAINITRNGCRDILAEDEGYMCIHAKLGPENACIPWRNSFPRKFQCTECSDK